MLQQPSGDAAPLDVLLRHGRRRSVLVHSGVRRAAGADAGVVPRHGDRARRDRDVDIDGAVRTRLSRREEAREEAREAATAPVHDWSSALALALLAHVAGWCALLVATRTASTAAQLAAAYAGALATAAAALATWSGKGDGTVTRATTVTRSMGASGRAANPVGDAQGCRAERPGGVARRADFFNFALAVAVRLRSRRFSSPRTGASAGRYRRGPARRSRSSRRRSCSSRRRARRSGRTRATALGTRPPRTSPGATRSRPAAGVVRGVAGLVLAACVHLGGVHLGGGAHLRRRHRRGTAEARPSGRHLRLPSETSPTQRATGEASTRGGSAERGRSVDGGRGGKKRR